MYKVVLSEASSIEDLRAWLDGSLLLQLWPVLWLPPQLRQRWEERFPELAAARTWCHVHRGLPSSSAVIERWTESTGSW
jgi:hypothetical protein